MESTIQKVAVIGTGVIGASWIINFLEKGLHVNAYDISEGAEERLYGYIDKFAPEVTKDHLKWCQSLEEVVEGVELVQENGPEQIAFKQALFQQLDQLTTPEVLLISSSSGVIPSIFQAKATYPERVLLGHPFNPPHLIPLVEVGGGMLTSEESIQKAIQFYQFLGKKPIRLLKEMKGHVANRLQAALWQEAMYLVQQGVASVEDVDIAISEGPGLRWSLLGPFMNLHLSGGRGGIRHMLEHLGPPMETWMDDLGKIKIDEATIDTISEQVGEYVHRKDFDKLVEERDILLKQLILNKQQTTQL